MNTHVVIKPLSTSDGILPIGTEVDASGWKRTRQLEDQRYIKPIQPDGRDKRMGRKDSNANTRN
jgi:hypothetical protein